MGKVKHPSPSYEELEVILSDACRVAFDAYENAPEPTSDKYWDVVRRKSLRTARWSHRVTGKYIYGIDGSRRIGKIIQSNQMDEYNMEYLMPSKTIPLRYFRGNISPEYISGMDAKDLITFRSDAMVKAYYNHLRNNGISCVLR